MTVSEFKMWLQGFMENMDSTYPSKTQWDRILSKISEIDDDNLQSLGKYRSFGPGGYSNTGTPVPPSINPVSWNDTVANAGSKSVVCDVTGNARRQVNFDLESPWRN